MASASKASRTRSTLPIRRCEKWVHRFDHEGTQGLLDRPRSGRAAKVTCELEKHLNRLVDQDPLRHGSIHSQWSCRELAIVLAQQTRVQIGRESVRYALKKCAELLSPPLASWSPTQPTSPMPISDWPSWSIGHVRARSFCSTKMRPCCGALPCRDGDGGAVLSATACPTAR
jgi:transposase